MLPHPPHEVPSLRTVQDRPLLSHANGYPAFASTPINALQESPVQSALQSGRPKYFLRGSEFATHPDFLHEFDGISTAYVNTVSVFQLLATHLEPDASGV